VGHRELGGHRDFTSAASSPAILTRGAGGDFVSGALSPARARQHEVGGVGARTRP
jgi:hypothetical protein